MISFNNNTNTNYIPNFYYKSNNFKDNYIGQKYYKYKKNK